MIESSTRDGFCTLRLNAPPLNTISLALLEELRAAIRQANADDGVRGIILTGGPQHFSAGADVGLFDQIRHDEDAVRISRLFQEAFQEVEDSRKPLVAAVAGRVIGGALELAMACRLRVAVDGTTFAMPEVNLGINPGSGGTQRLPRLVGLARALKMLLTAETVRSAEAQESGLVDAVCAPDALLETARRLLDTGRLPPKTRDRAERLGDAASRQAAFDDAGELLKKARPEVIAPACILAAVRAGVEESFEAGLVKEQEEFARCMRTLATRNKIYLFFATRQAGKVQSPDYSAPGAAPAPSLAQAAVVGMGSMGTGIAQALVMAGLATAVREENEAVLAKGVEKIRRSLQKRVAQGKLTAQRAEQMLGLLSTTTDWEPIAHAGVVIEAVFEDAAVKRTVLERLEAVCPAQTVLATNTSTISLEVLAQHMRHPERLVGMHFFNPAHSMPLVEVIHTRRTAPWAIDKALALAKTLRKTAVLVRNREGFLITRLFVPYCKEAFWMLQEGGAAEAIDAAAVRFGLPMGPLTLIDMTGLDILAHADAVLRPAFAWHGHLPPVVERLVAQGHLGQKTGSGVYRYEPGDPTPHPSQTTAAILEAIRRESARPAREIGQEEITQRLVLRMVNEAFHILQERIAQRESDIDVATVQGLGFPDFRGGVLKYARDVGMTSILDNLGRLAKTFGERFSPCELLGTMKGAE